MMAASGSPSAKRAWIEISTAPAGASPYRSPSAKRAWIEIVVKLVKP